MVDKRTVRRNVSRLAGGVFALLLALSFVWFVHTMMGAKSTKPQRQVQVVQVIRPPPPPPPPEQPPPPPERTEQALPKDQPEPVPDNTPAPADQPLGLDAEGAAGGDAFGLAARRGGSDLVGGTGSAPFAWYTNRIADAIRERLSSLACAKSSRGSLSFHVKINSEGRFTQAQLATTTGNAKLDQCIEAGVASTPAINDRPPPGMTEQITIKVVSRI
jgi:periplasmic protein TonB